MRFVAFCLGLILTAYSPAQGFEIEDRVLFGAPEAGQVLKVISTGDVDLFTPIVTAFLAERDDVKIDYVVTSSTELHSAIATGAEPFDVALSSAMDLQTKLVNDGHARAHRSPVSQDLPDWARWRDHLFAFTQEPAAIVLSRRAFEGLALPRTRQDLIATMRAHPDRFRGRVGTYDVRISGLGYLFATQDARTSETFWRLSEVMGALGARLYCCSSQMIDDVAAGELAVAYNVLGSYAEARQDNDDLVVLLPQDFTTVMLRTAFVPETAENPSLAGAFIDHLIRRDATATQQAPGGFAARRIRMGPGLLVFLDGLKKAVFLREWTSAVVQQAP